MMGPLFLEYADDTGVAVGDSREAGRFMGVGENVLGPLSRSQGPLTRSLEPGPLTRSLEPGPLTRSLEPGPLTRSTLLRSIGPVNRSANRNVQRDSSWHVCDGDKVAMTVVKCLLS